MNELDYSEKRRYARAISAVRAGVLCHRWQGLRTFELTTRAGDDNSWETFKVHFRKLVRELRRLDMPIEYCGAPELSPQRGLLHLHGIMVGGFIPHGKLSELWGKIHNAPIVYIRDVRGVHGIIEYIVKHTVKQYVDGGRGRLLISKGWLPKGWELVQKLLVKRGLMYEGVMGKKIWADNRERYEKWCGGHKIAFNLGPTLFSAEMEVIRCRMGDSDWADLSEYGESADRAI